MHIGTHVWFFPSIEDEAILRRSDSEPCSASVTDVFPSGRVDLVVIDHCGRQHERRSVAVAATLTERPKGEPDFCVIDWEPASERRSRTAFQLVG